MYDTFKAALEDTFEKFIIGCEHVAGLCPVCALWRGILIGAISNTIVFWLMS